MNTNKEQEDENLNIKIDKMVGLLSLLDDKITNATLTHHRTERRLDKNTFVMGRIEKILFAIFLLTVLSIVPKYLS